jgi:hypothetical protein
MITFRKAVVVFILSIFYYTNAIGQDFPPDPAMPADSNVLLIDKIIEVTNHETYFKNYCTKKVMTHAKEKKWKKTHTSTILNSINFENYKWIIYNSYAFFSNDQLTKLLYALKELDKESDNQTFILTTQMMQSNLDLYVKSLIEGYYVIKND